MRSPTEAMSMIQGATVSMSQPPPKTTRPIPITPTTRPTA